MCMCINNNKQNSLLAKPWFINSLNLNGDNYSTATDIPTKNAM